MISAFLDVEDETTNEEVAIRIIEALSSVRNGSNTYVAVSQQRLHHEDPWMTFAIGPFSTELKAAKAGEGMAPGAGRPGEGRWKVGLLLPTAAETWKFLSQAEKDEERFARVKGFKKDLDPEVWDEPEERTSW